MSESKVQGRILRYLEDKGYYVRKIVVANKAGTPDIVGCTTEGRFFAIEVKFGKGKLSALQEYNLAEVEKKNGIAIVAYSVEDVKNLL